MYCVYNNFTPRLEEWNECLGEDKEHAKKEILRILREQKVSLSQTRCLFFDILSEIEDDNPVTLE